MGAFPTASRATTVELHDGRLTIGDPDGVANVLDVRQLSLVEFEVYDDVGPLVSGTGCGSLSPNLARCAGNALGVQVDAGAGDDLIGLWSLQIPVELRGGEGDDALAGGRGPDQVWGGRGVDSIRGHAGEDRLSGEEGDDFADGDAGADTVLGGEGDDILDGRAGDGDVLSGGGGRDLIYGGSGRDELEGGAGDDTLIGGRGRDSIGTGLGSDDVFGGGGRINRIDCREGDRARGQAGRLPAGCEPLPASEPKPDVWPPRAGAAAVRSQVVFDVVGKPVRRGTAYRYWIWAGAPVDVNRKVRVRARLRRGTAVLHRACLSNIWTNKWVSRKVPRKARSATRVTGQVKRGRRCR